MPKDTANAIAAVLQIVAAVVRPETLLLSLKIIPAPRKPIPVTTVEAIRVSTTSPACCEINPNVQDPKATAA